MNKGARIIVISGINFFEGGPLTIFKDCLKELSKPEYFNFKIIALVHKKQLFSENYSSNISFLEFPASRKSYFFRLFFEYFYFYSYSKKNEIFLWVSLHDISPRVDVKNQVVYCHNPSIFRKKNIQDLIFQPKFFFQTLFYKQLYRLNIKSNKYIIVQQNWIRESFSKYFNLQHSKIIVARPDNKYGSTFVEKKEKKNEEFIFFYPALSRPFKNFELLCEAANKLVLQDITNFKILLTIDGHENKYTQYIKKKYSRIKNLSFLGLLSIEEVNRIYQYSDALLFPSKLETWGLPISEAKLYNLPIFAVDLPYAHETVAKYDKAYFFPENNALELSEALKNFINGSLYFEEHHETFVEMPRSDNWQELFKIILEE